MAARQRKPRRHEPWPTLEAREDALQRRLIELDRAMHRMEYAAVVGLMDEMDMLREIGKARGDTGWHAHRPPRHAWYGAEDEQWDCCYHLAELWPLCCPQREYERWARTHGA